MLKWFNSSCSFITSYIASQRMATPKGITWSWFWSSVATKSLQIQGGLSALRAAAGKQRIIAKHLMTTVDNAMQSKLNTERWRHVLSHWDRAAACSSPHFKASCCSRPNTDIHPHWSLQRQPLSTFGMTRRQLIITLQRKGSHQNTSICCTA